MNVTVRLGAPLWRRVNTKEITLELSTGATVAELLSVLNEQHPAIADFLNRSDVPPTLFLANELATPDTRLTDGAQLTLLWAIAGG